MTAAEKNIPLSEEEIEILTKALTSKDTFKYYCYGCGTIFLKQPTISILTDDGNLYCDACGFGLNRGFKFCPNCSREIDWYK